MRSRMTLLRPLSLTRLRLDRARRAATTCLTSGLVFMTAQQSAWASPGGARERARQAVEEVERSSNKLSAPAPGGPRFRVGKLMAEAELHLRSGQYEAAIDKLNILVELHEQGRAIEGTDADAHYMLGEAHFKTGELYSAGRHYQLVLDRADRPAYWGLAGAAASRLVDVTLRTHRLEQLPNVLTQVDSMIARAGNEALHYARAKVLMAMARFDEAISEAQGLSGSAAFGQRASYLRGTALLRKAQDAVGDKPGAIPDYAEAIAAFEEAASARTVSGATPPKDAVNARAVTELSWLAVARLWYEAQQFDRAATNYQKIPRESEYFAQALFELAWTHVRLGRYGLAQRALEALTVLNPGLVDGADGELLRADLLLREGKFRKAEEAYETVKKKFNPLNDRVGSFIAAHEDPSVYYDMLTAAEIEVTDVMPEVAVDWAREAAEEERVFAIVDDVARSRKLIKRSRKIASLLRASLASQSSAKLFPALLSQLENVVALLNQLSVARLSLARGMDEAAGNSTGELSRVRTERRKLMARLGEIPTNFGDFTVREAEAEKSWNSVGQSLQRLQLEHDHLRALVNGLRRMLDESDRYGVTVDAASLERFRQEINENEKDLAVYTKRIDELYAQVELGKVQSGFGDERFQEDERVRGSFRELFNKETRLAQSSPHSGEANYAASIVPILSRIVVIEGRLNGHVTQLNAALEAQSEETKAVLNTEAQAIEVYAMRLDTMDQHARSLVGEVAKRNFMLVRDRLSDVVLRADVGLVQHAWEVREEQKLRVFDLLRERAQEDRMINDELREVLDDSEELP